MKFSIGAPDGPPERLGLFCDFRGKGFPSGAGRTGFWIPGTGIDTGDAYRPPNQRPNRKRSPFKTATEKAREAGKNRTRRVPKPGITAPVRNPMQTVPMKPTYRLPRLYPGILGLEILSTVNPFQLFPGLAVGYNLLGWTKTPCSVDPTTQNCGIGAASFASATPQAQAESFCGLTGQLAPHGNSILGISPIPASSTVVAIGRTRSVAGGSCLNIGQTRMQFEQTWWRPAPGTAPIPWNTTARPPSAMPRDLVTTDDNMLVVQTAFVPFKHLSAIANVEGIRDRGYSLPPRQGAAAPDPLTPLPLYPLPSRPGRYVRERKYGSKTGKPLGMYRGSWVEKLFHWASEVKDFWEIMYDSLDEKTKKATNCSGVICMVNAVASNLDKIDPVKAAQGLAYNQIEDAAVGGAFGAIESKGLQPGIGLGQFR